VLHTWLSPSNWSGSLNTVHIRKARS
jgi:hypothetical protein